VGSQQPDSVCARCKAADQRIAQELSISPDEVRLLREIEYREITPDDFDLLTRLRSQPTLDRAVHRKLMERSFVMAAGHGRDAESCAVCLEAMEVGDELCSLPCHSFHTFHAQCLDTWLSVGAAHCPTCREPLASGAGSAA